MHELAGRADLAPERQGQRLVTRADTQRRDSRSEPPDDLEHSPASRAPGAGR